MLLGLILMLIAGMMWVGVGVVVSFCAARRINLAVVQLGQTLVCAVIGGAVMLFQEAEPCATATKVSVFALLFVAGIGNFSAYELMNRAMRLGPNGVVWALAQSSLVFPFAFGVVFYGVTLTLWRLCGMIMLVVSIGLLGAAKGKGEGESSDGVAVSASKRWLWFALGSFMVGGATQICANMPSYMAGAENIGSVSRTVYLQLGALAGFGVARLCNPEKLSVRGTLLPTIFLSVFYIAIFFGLLFHGLNLLAAAGAGSIGYPVMIGSCIVLFFVYTRFMLREKASPIGVAGFLLCLAGIVTISI